eukprot:5774101-Prymnesium_polylepis.2
MVACGSAGPRPPGSRQAQRERTSGSIAISFTFTAVYTLQCVQSVASDRSAITGSPPTAL